MKKDRDYLKEEKEREEFYREFDNDENWISTFLIGLGIVIVAISGIIWLISFI